MRGATFIKRSFTSGSYRGHRRLARGPIRRLAAGWREQPEVTGAVREPALAREWQPGVAAPSPSGRVLAANGRVLVPAAPPIPGSVGRFAPAWRLVSARRPGLPEDDSRAGGHPPLQARVAPGDCGIHHQTIRQFRLLRPLAQGKHLRHRGLHRLLARQPPLVPHRSALRSGRVDRGALEAHPPQWPHPRPPSDQQDRDDEPGECRQQALAEVRPRVVVRRQVTRDQTAGRRLVGPRLSLARAEDTRRLAVEQQPPQQFGCLRRAPNGTRCGCSGPTGRAGPPYPRQTGPGGAAAHNRRVGRSPRESPRSQRS